MALCHNCDDTRIEYTGNGVQKDFTFPFEYNVATDVAVANWNDETLVWEPIPNTEWVFKNETTIHFNEAPAYGQKFIIYRCTDLSPLPAEFFAGYSIKAQDLNDNFFVLQSAIEEVRCAVSRNDNKSEEKYWDKVDDTITYEQQIAGEAEALLDEEHIFDAEAIAARHDSYVQSTTPVGLPYEQSGKIWNDTDDLRDYFWDSNVGTWISFTKTGPKGPPGGFGPAGKVIVSDAPPTTYPAVGELEGRELESGDLWFDSYNVLMYVYYVDNFGPAQWVSTTKTGPQGPQGEQGEAGSDGADGADGGEILTFTAPLVKTDTTVSIDLLTIPNIK